MLVPCRWALPAETEKKQVGPTPGTGRPAARWPAKQAGGAFCVDPLRTPPKSHGRAPRKSQGAEAEASSPSPACPTGVVATITDSSGLLPPLPTRIISSSSSTRRGNGRRRRGIGKRTPCPLPPTLSTSPSPVSVTQLPKGYRRAARPPRSVACSLALWAFFGRSRRQEGRI